MAPQDSVVVDERDVDSSSGPVQKTVKKRWVSYIWDTFDKPPEERRLLFKLDTAILTFASLGKVLWFLLLAACRMLIGQVTLSNTWIRLTLTMLLYRECKSPSFILPT